MDRAVDEHALAGGAALAGVQEAGGDRGLDGCVEVRVVEDHERPVAAHLEQLLLAGRALAICAPVLRRADEADRRDPRVPGDLVADLDRPGR